MTRVSEGQIIMRVRTAVCPNPSVGTKKPVYQATSIVTAVVTGGKCF
jgi:hypothetical protein